MIRIGPFDLDVPVGRGGMGEVWRATHRASLAPVAIKVLHRQIGLSERHIVRLRAEVRAMARLDHPGIAYVVDAGELPAGADRASEGRLVPGSAFVALEYASGGPLSDRCGKLEWSAQRALLTELLHALAHAHAQGVVHRDLKPGNVLLALPRDIRPGWKITDFGLSRALGDPHQTRHEVAGTPHYMAPEQIDRELGPHGPWTDLYAFGCLAWALASGRPPFADLRGADAAWAHLTRPIPGFEAALPVPAGLEPWLRRLLARLPDQRFPFAADALAELRELSDGEAAGPEDETVRGPMGESPARARPTDYVPASWHSRIPAFPRALRGAGLGLVGLRVPAMVGRIAERDLLWAELRAAGDGSRVVVLRGAEGLGRSRLAAWLGARAHQVGAATVVTVQPAAGDPPERALDAVVERLAYAERSGEIPPWLEESSGRVDLGTPERNEALLAALARDRTIDPTMRREVIRTLIERRVRIRPLLVVFDDVHLAPELVELVAELRSEADFSALPIVWVLTVRTDALGAAPRTAERLASLGGRVVDLGSLDPLSRASLVQEHGLTPALAAQVDQVTDGNPKAIADRLAEWVQRGWLVPGPTGFELAVGVDAWSGGSSSAWSDRVGRVLDGLPDDASAALEIAAVLGSRVDFVEWELTGAGGAEPAGSGLRAVAVDRLIAAHMAEETADGFVFAHAGVREALVDRARAAGRVAGHHERCAEMLTGRTSVLPPERLGLHLLESGQCAPAVDWLLAGAESRARLGGPAAGMHLLSQADRAMTSAGLASNDIRWGAFYLRYARAYLQLGEPREVSVWAERARAAGQRHRWGRVEASALALLGQAALIVLELDRAERLLLEAAAAAAAVGAWGIAGEVRYAISQVLAALGEESRSLKMADQARHAWSRSREPDAAIEVHRCAGWMGYLSGSWAEARRSLSVGRAHARDQANALAEAELLALECAVHRRAGDYDAAEAGLRELVAWYRLLGHRDAARAWCELALLLLNRARWAAAYEAYVEGGRFAALPGSPAAELRVAVAAAAAATTGRWNEVGPALDQAEAGSAARRIGLPDAEWCLGIVRDRAGASGRWDLARRADALAAEHQRKPMGWV